MTMKRKIIKLGQATYVTSLPSKWVRKYMLSAGDYLEMDEKGNQLVISTEKNIEYKTVTIELPKKEFFIKRLIYAPYRFGYDEIRFTYEDPTLIKEIQEAAKILMGFDIVDQGEHYCVFRNLSVNFEEEFENLFKRVFHLILNIFSDCIDALQKKEHERFKTISETEQVIDKITCFCERIINKRGTMDFTKNSFAYITIWTLEKVGDAIKHTCRLLEEEKNSSHTLLKLFEETRRFFELFFQTYYKPSLESIVKLKKEHDILEKEYMTTAQKTKGTETIILYHLLSCITEINNVALSIQPDLKDQPV